MMTTFTADHDHDHDHDHHGAKAAERRDNHRVSAVPGIVAVIFSGAIFGFFYAWVCSTMWGLDDADPRVAIEAMQAMNGSVRNAVFFPAFFCTPFVLLAAALVARRDRAVRSARYYAAAGVVYLLGGLVLTMAINVPMNEELAEVVVPQSIDVAEAIWDDYSGTWQLWNITRTVFSGISLGLASLGLASLNRQERRQSETGVVPVGQRPTE